MGLFDKLAFWKRGGDNDDFGAELGLDQPTGLGQGPLSQQTNPSDPNFGMGQQGFDPMQQQGMGPAQSPMGFQGMQEHQMGQRAEKTEQLLEVISSKLDAIKANMDAMNQRLQNLENLAKGDRKGRW